MENEARRNDSEELVSEQDPNQVLEEEIVETHEDQSSDHVDGNDEVDEEVEDTLEDSEEVLSEFAQMQKELEETTNRLLRVQADYDNFRRRTRIEKESAAKYRSQRLAENLLPALDNFERGMTIDPQSEETTNLLKGMEMVYRQLREALEKEGIHPIDTVGQLFDPHVHQAVMQVETDEYESNVVVEELQKGYQIKDRVIRPAMVKVNA